MIGEGPVPGGPWFLSTYRKIHTLLSKLKKDFCKGMCISFLHRCAALTQSDTNLQRSKSVLTKLASWVSFIAVIEEFNFCAGYVQLVYCLSVEICTSFIDTSMVF